MESKVESELIRDASGRITGAFWTLTCRWCGDSERIDVTRYRPVSDPRGVSSLRGWEVGHGLLICPNCVETDEQTRW